jgi:hypothetical protein
MFSHCFSVTPRFQRTEGFVDYFSRFDSTGQLSQSDQLFGVENSEKFSETNRFSITNTFSVTNGLSTTNFLPLQTVAPSTVIPIAQTIRAASTRFPPPTDIVPSTFLPIQTAAIVSSCYSYYSINSSASGNADSGCYGCPS